MMRTTETNLQGETVKQGFDVFISYSSNDKDIAFTLCDFLEKKNLSCWISPRNINPGSIYAEAILEGIRHSGVMVLLFNDSANHSNHVRNEVDRAFHHGLAIIPFRIQNIAPADSLEYFLSTTQWLDAFEKEYTNYLPQLYNTITQTLENRSTGTTGKKDFQNSSTHKRKSDKGPYIKTGILTAAILSAFAVVFFVMKNGAVADNKNDSPLVGLKDSINVRSSVPAEPNNKSRSQTVVENTTSSKIDLSEITGFAYQDYETKSRLEFAPDGNNTVVFSGRGKDYNIQGTMRADKNGRFTAIAGDVTGYIQFLDNYTRISGALKIKEPGILWNVRLSKTNAQ